jgi:hypothetical protein
MSAPLSALPLKAILFSRDRAMQADACLRSFFLHCVDAEDTVKLTVLYKASSPRHASQYERLATDYTAVKFMLQRNFRADVLQWLNPYPAHSSASRLYRYLSLAGALSFRPGSFLEKGQRHLIGAFQWKFTRALLPRLSRLASNLLFLVDDNLFVSDFVLQYATQALRENRDAIGLSLRLGQNTTYSYPDDKEQSLPAFIDLQNGFLKYSWEGTSYNFRYPLEISSSLYPETFLVPLLTSIAFHNPNELEAAMAMRAGYFRFSHPSLLCYRHSVTFCDPVNVVQSVFPNRAGERIRYPVNDLLERFDRGERVDVNAYIGFVPNSCHQEVDLVFRKGEK